MWLKIKTLDKTKNPIPEARRALLADDNHALRMVLGQAVSSFGFDVTYAENGKIALDLFDNTESGVDLICCLRIFACRR